MWNRLLRCSQIESSSALQMVGVCDGRWSEVDTVLKVLAKLYLQPKGHYVEVGRL